MGLLSVNEGVLIIMFINISQLLKEYYEAIKITIALRDKNLTDEQREIIIFGDLKTADEKLGRIRHLDNSTTYKKISR